MQLIPRPACPDDLPALEELERSCFTEDRQESRSILLRSMRSHAQEVWVLDAPTAGTGVVASMILRLYQRSMRIYSLAVHPDHGGNGYGSLLLQHAIERARFHRKGTVSLEAEAAQHRLVQWYTRFGFIPTATLQHYYSRGNHACRMRLILD